VAEQGHLSERGKPFRLDDELTDYLEEYFWLAGVGQKITSILQKVACMRYLIHYLAKMN
jgi:hypothetical protein